MVVVERISTMPRVTGVIKPLQDFSKIPPATLEKKSDEGKKKHKRLEIFFKRPQTEYPARSIESLMHGVLKYIPTYSRAVCEETCVRGDLTGHPDVYTIDNKKAVLWIGDYKFTLERYDTTALQLIGYEYLLDVDVPLYLFHFPTDDMLITYQVNPTIKPLLRAFFFRLYDACDSVNNDDFLKFDLRYEWATIVANNDLWLPVATNLPERSLTDIEQAERAVVILEVLAELEKVQEYYKNELKRFLKENPDIPSVETLTTRYKLSYCKGRAKFKKLPPGVQAKVDRLKEPYRLEPTPYTMLRKTEL
jgi:hypothetical protein